MTVSTVVDTYPHWADVSRAVVAIGAAVYFAALGYSIRVTMRRARGLIHRGRHERIGGD